MSRLLGSRRGLCSASRALLHHSRIPTMHFQDSLPKLPIPPLADSLERFLYFAKPLISAAEYREAEHAAYVFDRGVGQDLQQKLIKRDAAKYSSYISEPWFDMCARTPLRAAPHPLAYRLCSRSQVLARPQANAAQPQPAAYLPRRRGCRAAGAGRAHRAHARRRCDVPANSRVGIARAGCVPPQAEAHRHGAASSRLRPRPAAHALKRRAQPLWKEAMRWMPRSHAFYAAAVTNAYPLDMSQYANLFRSTRVPLPGRDELRTHDGSRHVVVQRGARFWALDILDESGATLPVAQLHAALQARAAIPRPAPARSRSRLCQSRPKPA